MDALTTLAFDYPDTPTRDACMQFFRNELENMLLMARESGVDPFAFKGSYAGAIGWPQFMPGSIRKFAVDFDDDGSINLTDSPSMPSAALLTTWRCMAGKEISQSPSGHPDFKRSKPGVITDSAEPGITCQLFSGGIKNLYQHGKQ
jgi:hypothetical protein